MLQSCSDKDVGRYDSEWNQYRNLRLGLLFSCAGTPVFVPSRRGPQKKLQSWYTLREIPRAATNNPSPGCSRSSAVTDRGGGDLGIDALASLNENAKPLQTRTATGLQHGSAARSRGHGENPMPRQPSRQCGGHSDRIEMYGVFATFIVTIAKVNTISNCYL
jgi:hypothetical protein